MVSDSAKTLELVIAAIKNLRELKGSTSKEILRYLSSVYHISPNVARRQMQTVLKRGVSYGILKKNGGYYILPTNGELKCQEVAAQEVNLLDACRQSRMQRKLGCKCKTRRRRRRRRKRQFCRCKRRKSRRSRRRRSRRKRSRARRSRRSKRRRSRGCGPRRRRRKCRCGGLGSKADVNRTKRATAPQTIKRSFRERSFDSRLEAYDSAASEKSSLTTVSSLTD
ncbi:uncharacterized protein LOC143422247 [Xylocopa sonorina]|uniref:uncharacterized protein LOC143422247 n=1 Tax=Xylocopa sonorina TaxID=1818115 RepID=UPI00403AEE0B